MLYRSLSRACHASYYKLDDRASLGNYSIQFSISPSFYVYISNVSMVGVSIDASFIVT